MSPLSPSRGYSTFEDVCILSACVDCNISTKLGVYCGIYSRRKEIFQRYCEITAEKGVQFPKRTPESLRKRLYPLLSSMYIMFGTSRERKIFAGKQNIVWSRKGPRKYIEKRNALLKLLYNTPESVKTELTLEEDISAPRARGRTRSKWKQCAGISRAKRKPRNQGATRMGTSQHFFDSGVEAASQRRNATGSGRRMPADVDHGRVASLSVRGGVKKNSSTVKERQLQCLMLLERSWKAATSTVQLQQENFERFQTQFKHLQDSLSAHVETLEMQQERLLKMTEDVLKGAGA